MSESETCGCADDLTCEEHVRAVAQYHRDWARTEGQRDAIKFVEFVGAAPPDGLNGATVRFLAKMMRRQLLGETVDSTVAMATPPPQAAEAPEACKRPTPIGPCGWKHIDATGTHVPCELVHPAPPAPAGGASPPFPACEHVQPPRWCYQCHPVAAPPAAPAGEVLCTSEERAWAIEARRLLAIASTAPDSAAGAVFAIACQSHLAAPGCPGGRP